VKIATYENLNLLYKLVQKGLPWPLGAFENKRSLIHLLAKTGDIFHLPLTSERFTL